MVRIGKKMYFCHHFLFTYSQNNKILKNENAYIDGFGAFL